MSSRPAAPLELADEKVLDDAVAAEVVQLAAAAGAADGVSPLDDQVRTEIAHGAGPSSLHVVGRVASSGQVVSYAHLSRDDTGGSGHLVVHPEHRRRGYGSALVAHLTTLAAEEVSSAASLRIWAHGDLPAAQAFAAAHGFSRVRDLWQMRRPLASALPEPSYPDDVTVRTFVPGRDDDAWVRLNAAAFASHPEQGRLTVEDLAHRTAEPWFDAAGFFLAERDGELVGSHWTKVHAELEPAVGEVYAVGIHPDAQGLGLGKALTLTGLHHLRERGLAEVTLYVDGDNTSAIGLYDRLGFTRSAIDVMYAHHA